MLSGESRMQSIVPLAIEHPELLVYREEFPLLRNKTYLNSCSLGALSVRSRQNVAQFLDLWDEWGASAWYEIWLGKVAEVRQKFAKLIGAQVHEVAIAPNVSSALSVVSAALDFRTRKKVVLSDREFPTLAYQFLAKERLGVECQFIESPDQVYLPPSLFEGAVDEQTALVATSRVSYTSGYIQDTRAVADIAHKHGASILIDDYQGTGVIPLNVVAQDIDFLVTGSLKWLLGGPGIAFIYVREGLIPSLEPSIAGWFGGKEQFAFQSRSFSFRDDAARLEMGTPAMAAVYAALGGLDIVLEASVQSIAERTRYLTNDLVARAREQGWTVSSPLEPEMRSSIVAIKAERPEEIVQALKEQNIIIDSRPGILRISPYFYNTIEENAVVIDAIASILKQTVMRKKEEA